MGSLYERYGPTAVVAGASEGLGRAFAEALGAAGFDLLLIARRRAPLEATADGIRARFGVRVEPVALDLASPDLEARFRACIAGEDVGLLVYNACYAPIGPFVETPLAGMMTAVDVNVRGPLVLAREVAPRLVARGRGGIVLMSSMSGLQGTALVGAYAATKAFDTTFGEALWAELGPQGVDVQVCLAGATATPNFERQTPREKRRLAFPMKAEDVVRGSLAHLGRGPVYVPGWLNRCVALGSRWIGRKRAVRWFSRTTRALYG